MLLAAQLLEDGKRRGAVVDEDRFGDLEIETAGCQAGIRQRGHDDVDDLATSPELNGRQVDGDLDVGAPAGGLGAGAGENPSSDRNDEPRRFGDRYEYGGSNPSKLGMIPAQQSFATNRSPGSGIDDRLVLDLELAIRQGKLQDHARARRDFRKGARARQYRERFGRGPVSSPRTARGRHCAEACRASSRRAGAIA